jgi:hypothetical protein
MTKIAYAAPNADDFVPPEFSSGINRDPVATIRSLICAVSCQCHLDCFIELTHADPELFTSSRTHVACPANPGAKTATVTARR